MAKRNSRVNPSPAGTSNSASTATAAAQRLPLRDPLSLALEDVRMRLEQADAVLGCLAHSLTYVPETETRPPYAPGEAATAARTLVRETLAQLDPIRLVQLMAASKLTQARVPKPC